MSNKFIGARKIGEDCFQVMMHSTTYNCDTCIHEAYFTLDNAKYWYLVFIYEFMYKCLDMDKIHFIEGDTDSMYWAIAGNPEENFKQGFKHVIKDKEYYDKNVFKFLPYNFFCFDEKSQPMLNTHAEKLPHEKKLLGLAVEKEGLNMVAL